MAGTVSKRMSEENSNEKIVKIVKIVKIAQRIISAERERKGGEEKIQSELLLENSNQRSTRCEALSYDRKQMKKRIFLSLLILL